jgi:type II secretory pathway component PulM
MSKSYLENLRPFEKRLLVGIAAILFVVLNVWFVFPHFSDWGNIKLRMNAAQEKLAKYKGEEDKAPGYRAKIKALQAEDQDVPPENQANQFSRAIQTQQAKSGVNVTSTGIITTRTNQFFLELSETIHTQSGEQQLVQFLYELGSGNSLIRVRDLILRPDQPRHLLTADIKLMASYHKKPPAPAPAPASRVAAAAPATSTSKKP